MNSIQGTQMDLRICLKYKMVVKGLCLFHPFPWQSLQLMGFSPGIHLVIHKKWKTNP